MTATIGILGGMGPLATAAFFSAVVEVTDVDREQEHLHVVVDSDPSIPDRTAFLLGRGPDPRPALIRAAQRLDAAGADLLVMPCNTANVFADDMASEVRCPIVPWLQITADAAALRAIRRVGVLATEGTIRTGVYQELLGTRGLSVVVPGLEDQTIVTQAIYGREGVKVMGRLTEPFQAELLLVAAHLARDGAECLVLGCTELPLGIRGDDLRWPIPAIDPAFAVAKATVREAGGRVRE